MSRDIAIRVKNLSKKFLLRQPQTDENGNVVNELWALKDVSFEIKKGESVGIVGSNGSGKSTLLKILAGITKPTKGTVEIHGRVASILDIGAGFHPELSGRENVFVSGQTLLGFSRNEIEKKFDEIVAFSGIKEFIDEPVKNYSKGMYLRLAFSIMAHLDFDVYLFDEVLSVGDAEFRVKTQKKFNELINSMKTIVIVSHNINELQFLDNHISIEKGQIQTEDQYGGDISLLGYMDETPKLGDLKVCQHAETITDFSIYPNSIYLKMVHLKLYQDQNQGNFRADQAFALEIQYEKLLDEDSIDVVFNVSNLQGEVLLSSSSLFFNLDESIERKKKGVYTCKCTIYPSLFNAQVYQLSLFFLRNISISKLEFQASEKTIRDNSERILTLRNIIAFKPIVTQLVKLKYNPSAILNAPLGLVPDFRWEQEFNIR